MPSTRRSGSYIGWGKKLGCEPKEWESKSGWNEASGEEEEKEGLTVEVGLGELLGRLGFSDCPIERRKRYSSRG